jgi:urease accessory protein UreF
MMSESLLTLLHLCDSLFPLGGFGYADKLETATASRLVDTLVDLEMSAWTTLSA